MMQLRVSYLLFLLISICPLCADVITLRADAWCPYTCNPGDEQPGFIIEAARVIFKKAGHEIDYQIMPWTKAIADVRAGEYNGIVGAFKSDAPDFIYPENEEGLSKMIFWTHNSNWHYDGIPSLKNITLGTVQGYSYNTDIDAYIDENKNDASKVQLAGGIFPNENNLKKLLQDKLGAILEDKQVMNFSLKQSGPASQVHEAGSLEEKNLYIAFSPRNPKSREYANILSKGIQEMRKSGELQQILSKYGLKDWKQHD